MSHMSSNLIAVLICFCSYHLPKHALILSIRHFKQNVEVSQSIYLSRVSSSHENTTCGAVDVLESICVARRAPSPIWVDVSRLFRGNVADAWLATKEILELSHRAAHEHFHGDDEARVCRCRDPSVHDLDLASKHAKGVKEGRSRILTRIQIFDRREIRI